MLTCASFFAGVGGIDKGFEKNKLFKIVYANEFDPYPVKTYELNSKLKVDCRDIRDVKADEIPDFDTMVDDKYYYTEGKYKGDIYEQLVVAMDDGNAIYQWRRKYVRKNKSGVVPTLTANQIADNIAEAYVKKCEED